MEERKWLVSVERRPIWVSIRVGWGCVGIYNAVEFLLRLLLKPKKKDCYFLRFLSCFGGSLLSTFWSISFAI